MTTKANNTACKDLNSKSFLKMSDLNVENSGALTSDVQTSGSLP